MKKITKKFMALALAVVMVLGMSVTAFAETPTGTLTISGTTAGKDIDMYQMFSATVSGTNVAYTLNDDFEAFFTSNNKYGCQDSNNSALTGQALSDAAYKYVSELDGDSARVAFAKEVMVWLVGLETPITATKSETATKDTTEIGDIAYGYYLIYPIGAADTNITGSVKSPAMLVSVTSETAQINMKSTYPTVDKDITDGEEAVSVGDTVHYTLTSYVPDMTGYNTYTFKFKDTLSKGLTLSEDSITVKIDEQALTKGTGYDVSTSTEDGETSIVITLKDFINYKEQTGKAITVTYSATLNENASIGEEGNTNKATVEYSTDPTWDSESGEKEPTDESTPDEVNTYTFDFTIDKYYDANGEDAGGETALAGAEFKLYSDADCTIEISLVKVSDAVYRKAVGNETGVTAVTPASGKLQITGLDEGTYYLVETKAPDGFNKLAAPVKVTISATYDTDADGDKKLTSYTVKYGDDDTEGENHVVPVENKSGTTLPSTGGMGVVIFTIVGLGILIVMMATSKKKKHNL